MYDGGAPEPFLVTRFDGRSPHVSPSREGCELCYRRGTQLFAAPFEPGPTPRIGVPHELFDRPYLTQPIGRANPNYGVAQDGRFVMIRVTDEARVPAPVVHVVRDLPALGGR